MRSDLASLGKQIKKVKTKKSNIHNHNPALEVEMHPKVKRLSLARHLAPRNGKKLGATLAHL